MSHSEGFYLVSGFGLYVLIAISLAFVSWVKYLKLKATDQLHLIEEAYEQDTNAFVFADTRYIPFFMVWPVILFRIFFQFLERKILHHFKNQTVKKIESPYRDAPSIAKATMPLRITTTQHSSGLISSEIDVEIKADIEEMPRFYPSGRP